MSSPSESEPASVAVGPDRVRRMAGVSDWYLAQLRPNQTDRARANLTRQGYGCFVPRRPVTRRRGGKLASGHAPLFPGYIFVRIAPDQAWHPVNSTFGVTRLVMRAMHQPQPVPVQVMSDLLARTDDDEMLRPPADLAPGDRVRIAAGPMSGFMAEVERRDAAGRVGLLLEMMGRAVRTALPAAHLERLAG